MDKSLFVLRELRAAQVVRFNNSGYDGTVIFGEIKEDGANFPNFGECTSEYRTMGVVGVFLFVLKGGYHVVEINEPFFLRSLGYQLSVLLAVFFLNILSSRRTRVVCYAIENMDVVQRFRKSLPIFGWIIQMGLRFLLGFCIGRLDRIVFGTSSAELNYKKYFRNRVDSIESRLIQPFEPVCRHCDGADKKIGAKFVFLGAFDERKGVEHVFKVWSVLREKIPGVSLSLIGQGPRKNEVINWANKFAEVEVYVAPPVEKIHRILAEARFLFLLSNETPQWKEQIGLPVLEGLSHGCWVISSISTGIATWLEENGSLTVDVSLGDFAGTIIEFVEKKIDMTFDAKCKLPRMGGREIAHRWLHEIV